MDIEQPALDLCPEQLSLDELSLSQTIHLLQFLPGFGPAGFWRLESELDDLRQIFTLQPASLAPLLASQPSQALSELRCNYRSSAVWKAWLKALECCDQIGMQVITYLDEAYPSLLTEIEAKPPVLYCRGDISLLNQPQLAIVGSRNASKAGLSNAQAFGKDLAAAGFTVTSGLALGIDGAAHSGALDVGGHTLGVLGCGLETIYPRRHQSLGERVLYQGGLLISEFAPGTAPRPSHFPRRNRIISGLSLGILVIEAALKSGSLITARYGLEHNREVFAIPGSIHNPLSRGCHALIKEGATLVEASKDIMDQLQGWLMTRPPVSEPTQYPCSNLAPDLSDEEHRLWQLIGFEPTGLEQLIAATGLSTGEVLSGLMGLELKGLIESYEGGYQRLS